MPVGSNKLWIYSSIYRVLHEESAIFRENVPLGLFISIYPNTLVRNLAVTEIVTRGKRGLIAVPRTASV